jgi:hypothetical protein
MSLSTAEWAVLDPPEPTRTGYGDQKDSAIDFFIISSVCQNTFSEISTRVHQSIFTSDHKLVSLLLTYKNKI